MERAQGRSVNPAAGAGSPPGWPRSLRRRAEGGIPEEESPRKNPRGRIPEKNGCVTAAPHPMSGLLARWGITGNADLVRAERGTNNRTFVVVQGHARWVLRISENLSQLQVRAEHRLLGRLRDAGLPFGVPEPVPTRDGGTLVETSSGPATLCRWIPGVRPDLTGEPELERFGRAIGLLSAAMRSVPPEDSPHDWHTAPPRGQPGIPGIEDLCRELTGAGVGREHAAALETAARRPTPWWSSAGGDLPVQVIHADLGASNTLVDEHTGQVTALLDFELAGPDYRVQDLVAALLLSGALEGPQWRRRVAALARGHVRALRLDPAEIQAIPDLLVCRGLGSVLWRGGRWRR